jgi:hypothetical protein
MPTHSLHQVQMTSVDVSLQMDGKLNSIDAFISMSFVIFKISNISPVDLTTISRYEYACEPWLYSKKVRSICVVLLARLTNVQWYRLL